jgi:hypothetical protein
LLNEEIRGDKRERQRLSNSSHALRLKLHLAQIAATPVTDSAGRVEQRVSPVSRPSAALAAGAGRSSEAS